MSDVSKERAEFERVFGRYWGAQSKSPFEFTEPHRVGEDSYIPIYKLQMAQYAWLGWWLARTNS